MTRSDRSHPEKRFGLAAAALALLTFVAYLPALNAGFIWDDDAYVTDNPTLRSVDGLWKIWTDPRATPQYYPLVHTTFWVEYHLWGSGSAAGYHLVNILLHAFSAILLYGLLRRLSVPGAWLAAALFAVHPVNVESVAWVTERKNCLSAVFYLLAFDAYLRGITNPPIFALPSAGESPRSRFRPYAISLIYFLLALFSKTVTVTFPAAMLLALWYRRGELRFRRDVAPLVPFFMIGLAMAATTGYLERTRVGASGPEWAFSPLDRVLIASRAICFYAAKLAVPINLSFIYPRWTINAHDARQYAYLYVVLAAPLVLYLLRRKIGRGPVVAVLFFMGTLVPALGFVNVYPMRYSFVADHFQYLATVGLLALFAAAIYRFISSASVRAVVSAVIVVTLAALTFCRTFAYHDPETLWRDTVTRNPSSWMAHANLGHALKAQGRYDDAFAEYQKELALAPDLGDPHQDVGYQLAARGQLEAAIAHFRTAISLNPKLAPSYEYLAKALITCGQLPEAQSIATAGTRAVPDYPGNYFELARSFELSNQPDQAAKAYIAAIDRGLALPDAAEWTHVGGVLLNSGHASEAANCFQQALEIDANFSPAQVGLRRARAVSNPG